MMSDAAGGSGKSDDSGKDALPDALTANASEPAAGANSTATATATTSIKKPFDFLNKTPLSFQSILDENPSHSHFSSRPDALTSYADIGSSYRSSSASGTTGGSSYGNSNTTTSSSQLGECTARNLLHSLHIHRIQGLWTLNNYHRPLPL
jgi:hypothetical protein